MNKKLIAIIIASILLGLSLFLFYDQGVYLAFASGENNSIKFVEIWQLNGTTYQLLLNSSSSGFTQKIHDNWKTRIVAGVQANASLFSSQAQAKTYSNVTMNITGVWVNKILNYTATWYGGSASFYYFKYTGDWNATLPVSGSSYPCSIDYATYW